VSTDKKPGDEKSGADKKKRRKKGGKFRLRAPVHYLAYALIALFLVLVDPFRWQEITDTASQDLAYRMLIGPLYPTDHREDITVVLLNEATLNSLKATWPVAMKTHADILRTIRRMRPRAVMVDFVFPDERNDLTLGDLQTEIRNYKDKNIPLYFARAEGANIDWIRSGLSDATLTSIVNPLSDGVSRTYEPCSRLSGGRSDCACEADGNTFQACPAEARPATPGSPVALTAAFELFGYPKGLKDGFDIRDAEPMEVVWSNRINEINDSWMRKRTPWGLEDLCLDIGSGFWDWLTRIFSRSEQYSFRQTCPYTTTVPAHGLFDAPNDPKLREALSNKFVFYGADLTGLEDAVVPPTHVKLPGVYLHAMALDNLLTFDGRYKRSSVSMFGVNVRAQYVTAVVALVIALIVVAVARSKRFTKAQKIKSGKARGVAYFRVLWRRWGYWILFNLGSLAVILAVFYVLYDQFRLSPKNWLGYWGLLFALSSIAKGRLVEGFLRRVVKHLVPSLRPIFFMEKRT